MDITRLIDDFGDDVFALALVVTKDFTSAKKVFINTMSAYEDFSDVSEMYELAVRAYKECADTDSNEGAAALTGVELDAKRQALLEEVLKLGEISRTVVHMFYENDLDEKQIAKITGQSEKYISSVLGEISEELSARLEKDYKYICTKIKAEDKLKAYVIRSVTSGNKRRFEVKDEAVPVHTWKKEQKIVVCVIAVIITVVLCIVIPLLQQYIDMREREGDLSSYDEISDGESFYYTYEASEKNEISV